MQSFIAGQRDKKDKTLCTVKAQSFVLRRCRERKHGYIRLFPGLFNLIVDHIIRVLVLLVAGTKRLRDRLHVLAVSDEEEEQRIKLRVRDAVLSFLSPELETVRDKAEAERIVSASLPQIKAAAESAAEGRHVTVTLEREHYPTRRYGSFALPAGEYESLRVILGKGEGHNWWCVVFPPVCLAAVQREALRPAMNPEDYALLTREEGWELRFRSVELWGELVNRFEALRGRTS